MNKSAINYPLIPVEADEDGYLIPPPCKNWCQAGDHTPDQPWDRIHYGTERFVQVSGTREVLIVCPEQWVHGGDPVIRIFSNGHAGNTKQIVLALSEATALAAALTSAVEEVAESTDDAPRLRHDRSVPVDGPKIGELRLARVASDPTFPQTVEEFAISCGVGPTHLRCVERGVLLRISRDWLEKVAAGLGVSLDDLTPIES